MVKAASPRRVPIVWRAVTPDEYVEAVLDLVERIPPGRVMSYGAVADALAERSGRSSARLVGNIMARHGGAVPWHRVVNSAGRLPPGHEREARARLRAEGTPLRGVGVDMTAASWSPGSAGTGEGP
ncbi:O(6)-alkylguanine repair protein YbaZ [Micromonospora avicenniae]|uniref:O(6)-alkylguanine repair protein YbaZ n=1 Tax=Micromonospora avicenniae TaxID=1198245 RepID=A0A1N6QD84_9ACTN|nr:O(6)-alkylguanine repair protein YbaZ [Micromonospora avicenniae]